MYENHFQFNQPPFSIAPDPNFLYLSDGHSEALAHLMYGFSNGGFVLITGEVGTGKTTLLRNLIKQTPPDLDVAFVLNPRLTVKELLETLCDELAVAYPEGHEPTVKQYIDVLNKHLLQTHKNGRSTVMIIDEAQNLSPAVLEQVRLLTNLETDDRKLLRIILLGQPELGVLLDRPELRQLAQRVTARYHLGALTREDCYAYVVHRLSRAGGNPRLFSRYALARLYRISKGIPRLVNVVADRALLGAYVEGKNQVTARIVNRAANEVLGKRPRYRLWLGAGIVSASAAGVAFAYFYQAPITLPTDLQSAAAPTLSAVPTPVGVDPEPTIEIAERAATKPTVASAATPAGTDTSGTGVLLLQSEPAFAASAAPAGEEMFTPDPGPEPNPPTESEPRTAATAIERPPMTSFNSQRRAYAAVFAAWGADYSGAPASAIPCNFAPSAGLQCLGQRGSWSDIARLNLPVVLELWDGQAGPYYAALIGRQGDELILHVGDETISAAPRALRDVWFGQYVLLWQTPPDYHGNLRPGDTHPTVGWLRDQLASLADVPLENANPQYFDTDLETAVREFQSAEGLLTDGIVGPATWIRVADRLQLPAPNLDG